MNRSGTFIGNKKVSQDEVERKRMLDQLSGTPLPGEADLGPGVGLVDDQIAALHEELASLTPEERRRGLMFRDSLAPDRGMLFVFPSPTKTSFVMRRCRFPIDLVQMGPGGRIDRMEGTAAL